MRRVATLVVLLVLVAALIIAALTRRSHVTNPVSRPVIRDTVFTSFKAAPDSLRDMVHKADVVLVGTIEGNGEPHDLDEHELQTLYRVRTKSVLHTSGRHPLDPNNVAVLRRGGTRERPDHTQVQIQNGFPAFELNHTYVLFLAWDDFNDAWMPAFGPPSVIDLTSGSVHVEPDSPLRQQEGISSTELLDLIRGAVQVR